MGTLAEVWPGLSIRRWMSGLHPLPIVLFCMPRIASRGRGLLPFPSPSDWFVWISNRDLQPITHSAPWPSHWTSLRPCGFAAKCTDTLIASKQRTHQVFGQAATVQCDVCVANVYCGKVRSASKR